MNVLYVYILAYMLFKNYQYHILIYCKSLYCAGHSTRRENERQTEKEMGGQHPGMD